MKTSTFGLVSFCILTVGALGGYTLRDISARMDTADIKESQPSLREKFLTGSASSECDYEKLASVCLRSANRLPARDSHREAVRGSVSATSSSAAVLKAKSKLDEIMSLSLEEGRCSSGAGFAAEAMLRRLPPADAADFEKLIRAVLERGDMEVQVGAWVPENLN